MVKLQVNARVLWHGIFRGLKVFSILRSFGLLYIRSREVFLVEVNDQRISTLAVNLNKNYREAFKLFAIGLPWEDCLEQAESRIRN